MLGCRRSIRVAAHRPTSVTGRDGARLRAAAAWAMHLARTTRTWSASSAIALLVRDSPAATNSSSVAAGSAHVAWPFRGQFAVAPALSGRSAVSSARAVPEALSALEPSICSSSLTAKRSRLTGRLRHLYSVIDTLASTLSSISTVGKSEKCRPAAQEPPNIKTSLGNWLQSRCNFLQAERALSGRASFARRAPCSNLRD